MWGLGFRVWGLGFRVSGFGFRVPDLRAFGFRVLLLCLEGTGLREARFLLSWDSGINLLQGTLKKNTPPSQGCSVVPLFKGLGFRV